MKLFFSFFVLLSSLHFFSQTNLDYSKVEQYILNNKLDSASYFLNTLKDSPQKELLNNLITTEKLTYADYYLFISNLTKRQGVNYLDVQRYINNTVLDPLNKNKIDKDFYNIKWILTTKLLEDAHLKEGNEEQKKLENYVNQFSENTPNYRWATTKLKTHSVVMYFIEKELKKGKNLSLKCLKIAEDLNDIDLQIAFLYNYGGYLLNELNVDKFITTSERILSLDKQLPKHSFYYYKTIRNIINAYIYKGGYDKEVAKLIEELYNSEARVYSYLLYVQMITKLNKDSEVFKTVLKKFEVSNVLELIKKLEVLGKNQNSNGYFFLIDKFSRALQKHKYYDEALAYKEKGIALTRKIYSEELSASLANFKITQAEKEKERELKQEKEKTNLYLIIALLSLFLLSITFITLKKLKKQSLELSDKNKIIKKSLNEKDLLVKEMHHRVKNNFQLITSLLELQTKDIEDEKALQLALEGKNRVNSMALIHQKLYQNKKGLIDFNEFINLLVKEINTIYDSNNKVSTIIDSKNMLLDIDTAIPLGLIINEIITNAYKYAFIDLENKRLEVFMNRSSAEDITLIVQDNGPGISEKIDLNKTKSLGLRLIKRLVKQLHGVLKINNVNGTRFEITVKDFEARKAID
ncbi:histidine kinase dimerization/phosphoacceptor domain -containing protein [uncultured Polaribacter sp.]|uniref:sensor histidine kinase n=1 Tax=uncultured Polaribacter sp. TaxID=174711 RepID=UPI002619C94E|nr:histidine kinase dimerization/phosphoacceptor domain -containing protein [uncultured Polaribacter sp.]